MCLQWEADQDDEALRWNVMDQLEVLPKAERMETHVGLSSALNWQENHGGADLKELHNFCKQNTPVPGLTH